MLFQGVVLLLDAESESRAIELSKAAYRKMVENLVWAAGYNVVAIPLAGGVLASRGILNHKPLEILREN